VHAGVHGHWLQLLYLGEIAVVIQNFTRFSKSNNDLQYHFVVFYYIIHFEMSISKSYAHFAQNYNIIHIFSTSALYHSCSRFGARHLHLPQHLSILGGVHRTNMNMMRRIAMLYFIIVVCSSVVAPALCHLLCYMRHRVNNH
jgi:hypothetical protein